MARHYWTATNFILRSQFPDAAGRSVWWLQNLLKPIHSANIDLREACRRSGITFPSPYVWLNKSHSFHYAVCSPACEAWHRYICCLLTRSYIIYFFNCLDWCSPVGSGHWISSASWSPGRRGLVPLLLTLFTEQTNSQMWWSEERGVPWGHKQRVSSVKDIWRDFSPGRISCSRWLQQEGN